MISALIEMFSFSFMHNALLAGVLGGGLLAFLGIFIHLRRIVFLGAALPQIVALGIAGAVFLSLPLVSGAVIGGAIGVFMLSMSERSTRLPSDSWIGIAYAAGSSIAIVLIALSTAPDGTVLRFFTGDILGTSKADVYYTLIALVPVILIFILFWDRFVLCGFDPFMARALGIMVKLWDAVLFFCLALGLSVVMNTAGGMLAFSMLAGPSAAGLLLSKRFSFIIIYSIMLGCFAAFIGLVISFLYDLPGGPTMAACGILTIPSVLGIKLIGKSISKFILKRPGEDYI